MSLHIGRRLFANVRQNVTITRVSEDTEFIFISLMILREGLDFFGTNNLNMFITFNIA